MVHRHVELKDKKLGLVTFSESPLCMTQGKFNCKFYHARLYLASDFWVRWIPLQDEKSFFTMSHHKNNHGQATSNFKELTFVVKNSFLKEKADLVSTGNEIVSISLQNSYVKMIVHYSLKAIQAWSGTMQCKWLRSHFLEKTFRLQKIPV